MPSSSPSACVSKISTNRQKIDLPIDDPRSPEVAVDGKNVVVVVRDGGSNLDPAYIIFHSWKNNEWQRLNDPTSFDGGDQLDYSVALSGKTAIVGFPRAHSCVGSVLMLGQNQFGGWEKMEDLVHVSATSNTGFGHSVGIDGDLAFVGNFYYVYMFRQGSNGKWIEFDMVDGCANENDSISGDVIAVESYIGRHYIQMYKFTQERDEIIPIQDPITTGTIWSMDLSNDYMAYWDGDEEDAFIYR